MKPLLAGILSFSSLAVLPACSEETAPKLDVPYVPTPQETVDAMLDMVDLQDGDVVWDLGCGDGRMVVTAAKRKNIRGVGVDIDPERIEESKANAEKAGVQDEVEFRVADLFETDFSDATVLTMYLLESVNRRLRPVILRDLQPGARIVSNTFTMGEWKPDETKRIEESWPRTIYHWVVPANISGEWTWEMEDSGGTMTIEQKFQGFSGSATIDGEEFTFQEGGISGKDVTFTIDVPDRGQREYKGTADGDTMTGTIDGKTWTATRREGTAKPLDEAQPQN
jgi:precorrin-6B methylase 2